MTSMYHRFVCVLYLLAVLFAGKLDASDSLKIMTYNIQGMKPGTDPETRLVHIIDKLIELDPDIIGIQEINETLSDTSTNQCKIIADSLGSHFGMEYYYYYSFTHLSWNNTFREFVGIISKYPILDSGYKQLPPGLFIRKCVWSYIDSPLGKINFFSTHLSFTNVEARIPQVEEIIPYVEETEQNNPGIASILVGDFNDEPNSEPITMLTSTAGGDYYIDTFFKVHPYGNPGYTVDSDNPERRIDYVFLKNSSPLLIENSYVVMNEPYSGNLFCSDHLGVLTIFKPGPTGINEEALTPVGFKLYQNYPNPFNPVTTIKYSMPFVTRKASFANGNNNGIRQSAGFSLIRRAKGDWPASAADGRYNVTLKIYNMLGKEVATLINKQQPPGDYKIKWDASDYPSGVYFYKLQAGNYSTTKKLILIR